jgi:DUF1680 family protein
VKVKLTQETAYPWDGKVHLKVEPEKPVAFTLKLRVPGWAAATQFSANDGNGKSSETETGKPDTYISQKWQWHPGATADLTLPMPAQFIESNPAVEENRNQLAVQRGPVVYCLESPDMQGVKMNDVSISPAAKLTPRFDSGLLDGVAVIDTEITVRPQGEWKDQLTRPLQTADERKIPAHLVPVFSWGNRGKSEMSVWLPASR